MGGYPLRGPNQTLTQLGRWQVRRAGLSRCPHSGGTLRWLRGIWELPSICDGLVLPAAGESASHRPWQPQGRGSASSLSLLVLESEESPGARLLPGEGRESLSRILLLAELRPLQQPFRCLGSTHHTHSSYLTPSLGAHRCEGAWAGSQLDLESASYQRCDLAGPITSPL